MVLDTVGIDLSFKLSICLLSFFFFNELYHFMKMHYFSGNVAAAESFTGCVHAFLATVVSGYTLAFYDPLFYVKTYDYYTKPYPFSPTAFSVSYGFFLWHLYIYALRSYHGKRGYDLLIHALLCLWTYSVVIVTPYLHRPAIMALFYEFSTLWLNSVDLLRFYKFDKLKVYFKLIFAVAFFYCRLVVGGVLLRELCDIFVTGSIEIKRQNEIPSFGKFSALSLIVLFYVLNVYWMTLIIHRVCSIVIPSNDTQANHFKSSAIKHEK